MCSAEYTVIDVGQEDYGFSGKLAEDLGNNKVETWSFPFGKMGYDVFDFGRSNCIGRKRKWKR